MVLSLANAALPGIDMICSARATYWFASFFRFSLRNPEREKTVNSVARVRILSRERSTLIANFSKRFRQLDCLRATVFRT